MKVILIIRNEKHGFNIMNNNLLYLLLNKKKFFFTAYIFLIVFFQQLNAQNLSVQGTVTASRYPVKNASVTFVDNSDTTNKFSDLTDDLGNYQISIPTSISDNTNI